MDQRAAKVRADQPVGRVGAAGGVDEVGAQVGRGGGVKPVAQPPDAPAGLVAGDAAGFADRIEDRLVLRLASSSGGLDRVADAAGRELKAKERAEQVGDLSQAHAQRLVQEDHRAACRRPDLRGAAAGGLGGLQRVRPAPPPAAADTAGDGNLKTPHDRADLNVALDLLVDGLDNRRRAVAAVRAGVRRRHVDQLVRPRRLGHGAKRRRRAVIVATLAARLLRIRFGRALGERRRLAFAAATQLLDQRLQGGHAGFQLGVATLQFRDAAVTLHAARTGRIEGKIGLHADCSTPPIRAGAMEALNNYGCRILGTARRVYGAPTYNHKATLRE